MTTQPRRLLVFASMLAACVLAATCVLTSTERATELPFETPDPEVALVQSNDSWTATLYAKAVYSTGPQEEMTLNNGNTLFLHPGQKACVAFLTGDDNLDHNLTPIVGWHDTQAQDVRAFAHVVCL